MIFQKRSKNWRSKERQGLKDIQSDAEYISTAISATNISPAKADVEQGPLKCGAAKAAVFTGTTNGTVSRPSRKNSVANELLAGFKYLVRNYQFNRRKKGLGE